MAAVCCRRAAGQSVFRGARPRVGAIRMNEERRCLVIDEQPAVRLGVRGLLADRYEVEEAADGQDALRLISSIGDFDVAIVELVLAANGTSTVAPRDPRNPRAAPRTAGARDRRSRRAAGAPRGDRGDRCRGHGLRRQELADHRARPRRRRGRRRGEVRRPRRPQRRPPRAHPPPAPDPSALRRRALDRCRRARARPEHRDRPDPHQGPARPPRGPRPHPRGRDRPRR